MRKKDTKKFVGQSGETHQQAKNALTSSQGVPISDNQNSLRIGSSGPSLLEDFHLREKIFHFDHERIPERVVHARGFGTHGFFETYRTLSNITCADLFQRKGEKTPVFVRFSTVVGNKGSPDLARDVRGFAVKMYTKEGNWDLVGNNIPVFFIQDAIKFSVVKMIAPKIGGIKTKQGIQLEAQYTIDNGSIFFDAVVFLLPENVDPKLVGICSFIQDAFIHAKFIAYTQSTLPFFKKIGLTMDKGFFELKTVNDCKKFITKCRKLRFWERLEKQITIN